MRVVVPDRLFCGGEALLARPAAMTAAGVQALVVVAPLPAPVNWPRDLPLVRIALSDDGDNRPTDLRLAVSIIREFVVTGRATLVICSAGLSRSVALSTIVRAQLEGSRPQDVLAALAKEAALDVSPAFWAAVTSLGPI